VGFFQLGPPFVFFGTDLIQQADAQASVRYPCRLQAHKMSGPIKRIAQQIIGIPSRTSATHVSNTFEPLRVGRRIKHGNGGRLTPAAFSGGS